MNTGLQMDSYSVSVTGGGWTPTVYDATCVTPISTTPAVAPGDSVNVCVEVDVPADAGEQDTNATTFSATSEADPSITQSRTSTTIAVQFQVLVVDGDTNAPVDSAPYYTDALDANNIEYGYWDLAVKPQLPPSYLTAHDIVVWFTGNSTSGPLGPFEPELAAFLDHGGRLLMSGQDILDGSPGTSSFVQDYLHIDWDGSEADNDRATSAVHSVNGNPVTDGVGSVALDHTVLGSIGEDELVPIAPATAAFADDAVVSDALTVADAGYKVMFLGFPFEAYGTAPNKADLMNRVVTWFFS